MALNFIIDQETDCYKFFFFKLMGKLDIVMHPRTENIYGHYKFVEYIITLVNMVGPHQNKQPNKIDSGDKH